MMCHYVNAGDIKDPMPGRYPTRDEILEGPSPLFRQGLFKAVSAWKKDFYEGWAEHTKEQQYDYLQDLADRICLVYERSMITVYGESFADMYSPIGKLLLTKPSIISLLHELSHHLFGDSEYHACRFSVWLYQRMFKSSYNKLVWATEPGRAHLLVLPS